jgi:hypothetical protein
MLAKVISGGQTGADRGGLDAAIQLGIPHGGWCPRGRRAEDGRVPDIYQLRETMTSSYVVRTEMNIAAASGTLICTFGSRISEGGTKLTYDLCKKMDVPVRVVDPFTLFSLHDVREWCRYFTTLNVAGPRESRQPGLQRATRDFLVRALA